MVVEVKFKAFLTQLKADKNLVLTKTTEIHQELADKGKLVAINAAPVFSGALVGNIKAQKSKNFSRILSFTDKPFPYHLWINARNKRFGFKDIPAVRLQKPYGDNKTPVAYGDRKARTRGNKGNPYTWTGEAGYFNKALLFVEKEASRLIKKKEKEIK